MYNLKAKVKRAFNLLYNPIEYTIQSSYPPDSFYDLPPSTSEFKRIRRNKHLELLKRMIHFPTEILFLPRPEILGVMSPNPIVVIVTKQK